MKNTGGCLSLGDFYQHIFKHLWDFFLGIPDRQLNPGHMCFSVQMSSIKMLNVDKVRAYLSNLNTMDVIWLGNRLGDQKAKLLRENKQLSEADSR